MLEIDIKDRYARSGVIFDVKVLQVGFDQVDLEREGPTMAGSSLIEQLLIVTGRQRSVCPPESIVNIRNPARGRLIWEFCELWD